MANEDKLQLTKEALASGSYDKETIEYIFPELRESEDKRIRKEIIKLVQFYYGSSLACQHIVSKDDMIAWLKKQGEKSVAWSEEDDETLNSILSCVEHCRTEDIEAQYNGNRYVDLKRYESMIDWLKSIKPQNHWKPSEEQMEALNAINILGELSYIGQAGTLVKLYNDLKKL